MEVRTSKVSIRLSDRELKEVVKLSDDSSMSVSSYGRKRLLSEPVQRTIVPEVNLDTYRALVTLNRELKAIGNNLNQSVKALNSDGKLSTADLVTTIERIEQELKVTAKLINKVQTETIGVA